MKTSAIRHLGGWAAGGLAAGLLWVGAGCASQPERGYRTEAVVREPVIGAQVVEVRQAPPPPLRERRPQRPGREFVWVPGYWLWRGNAYVWVAGQWQRPPHRRAHWVEPRWEHRGNSYLYIEGRWN
ncbi:YXWGXW repeat-containing protein [Horticoccus luteus]|uniref:YXWGXW repeat-containing protein n=1 Tax=Horticoccus luteus TaxID=2862869 RepID=A0A8F9TW46_9BACT|nr:hypothetical protein [Horticoccus luteus]QYM79167.1 YXWGXW repeat-containing protein [Horticoccus luteus]